ncbi:MAG: hypothetical protein IH977_14080 [Nitrospinae bacterium]|nr:hypothetical protein [Nitrospinota bacterium]
MQRRLLQAVLLVMVLLPLSGCGIDIFYPTTSGSHARVDRFGLASGPNRFIIWSNNPAAQQYLTSDMLFKGHTVVERARLDQLFEEQRIILSHTPEDAGNILRVGRLVGASHVIFIQVTFDKYDKGSPVSVSVRNVGVESGEIVWSGMAYSTERVASHDEAAQIMTGWAVLRAVCPVEAGYRWIEPSSGAEEKGCVPSGGETMKKFEWYDKGMWQKR